MSRPARISCTAAQRRLALAGFVVMMLLLGQTLGLIHRVAHGSTRAPADAGSAWAPSLAAVADESPSSGLQGLFGSHDQRGDCESFDKVSTADLLLPAPLVLAAEPVALPPAAVHRTWHLAAQSSGFLARGPPALG